MATSGTTNFTLDLVELVEEAYERVGGAEVRTGYELRTARRSLNLLFNTWANRGINLWTVATGTIPLVQGTATYDLPDATVDLLEHVIRQNTGSTNNQTDINISRISVSTYSTIPNKLTQGRPIQVYIDRLSPTPTITVWPVPDNDTYSFVYWRLRRIEDAGNGVNTMDVPFRFVPAMVAGLAYQLALKRPDAFDRIPMLKAMADEEFQLAADEDRDRAPVRFVPRIAQVR